VVATLLILCLSGRGIIALLKIGNLLMGLGELLLQFLVILSKIVVVLRQVGHLAVQIIFRVSQGRDLIVKFLNFLCLSIKVGLKSHHLLLELFNLKLISFRGAR
jgi:hypothetical protein